MPETDETYKRFDRGHERRLSELITGVVETVQNRKPLHKAKAALRTLRHTNRVSGTDAAFCLSESGTRVVLTVVAIPAALAGTVVTGGLLPVGMVVTAAVTWGVSKAFQKLHHNLHVDEILKALRRFEEDPARGGPDLRPQALAQTLDLARNMVHKIISDTEKLKKEIDQSIKKQGKGAPKRSHAEVIRDVLAQGRKAAAAGGTSGALRILPIHTKSKAAGKVNAASLVHLRLQRIHAYIHWVYLVVEGLKRQTLDEIEQARAIEPDLIRWISDQVHALGNHHACDQKFCFGPGPADFHDLPLPSHDPLSAQARRVLAGYDPAILSSLRRFHATVQQADAGESAAQKIGEKILDQAMGKAESAIEDLADEVGKEIGRIGGETLGAVVGQLFGDLGTGALQQAVELAKQNYRVNRPLLARVRAMQEAMQSSGPVSVDRDIADLAAKNDINAIMRALVKATYHYPLRIAERSAKLRSLYQGLLSQPDRTRHRTDSRFASCTQAATSLRYLLKVYHSAEKQMVHLHFVSLGLDTLSDKVFGIPFSPTAGPDAAVRPRLSPAMLTAAIAGLRHTTPDPRPDPDAHKSELRAFEAALQAGKAGLQATQTRVADPVAQMRAAWAPVRALDLSVAGKTFVSRAVKAPGSPPVDVMLSDAEWKEMSSIWGFRTDLTKTLDTALKAYRESYLRHRMPNTSGSQLKQEQLGSLLARLQQRRADLRATLEAAIDHWLRMKQDKGVSKRRGSVEQLKAMVVMEARALDQAITTLGGVSAQAGALGMAAGGSLQDLAMAIEAEDD